MALTGGSIETPCPRCSLAQALRPSDAPAGPAPELAGYDLLHEIGRPAGKPDRLRKHIAQFGTLVATRSRRERKAMREQPSLERALIGPADIPQRAAVTVVQEAGRRA